MMSPRSLPNKIQRMHAKHYSFANSLLINFSILVIDISLRLSLGFVFDSLYYQVNPVYDSEKMNCVVLSY